MNARKAKGKAAMTWSVRLTISNTTPRRIPVVDPDVLGLLVTVTRVAGSSGRVWVDYTTVDGDPR